jgi:hypothetical protein
VSTTTQYITYLDLFTALQNAVRVQTGITATENQAKRAINVALVDMHVGIDYKLPWAERSALLRTQARYSTGTVTITRGSTSLVGVGSTWNTNNDFSVKNVRANGKIVFNGSRVPYRVASVSSDTALTLSTAFTEASISGGNYVYFEDEYDLATDFLRPVDAQQFSDEISIDLISRTEFRRRYPTNTVPGRPSVACLLDFAPSGNTTAIRRVKLAVPPADFMLIPYSYITGNLAVSSAGAAAENMSADADEPIVPKRYRAAILYHALYNWYRDKKDDSRSGEAKGEYTDLMARIMMDQEVGAVRPQLRPRVSNYKRSAQSPYSGNGRGWRRAG